MVYDRLFAISRITITQIIEFLRTVKCTQIEKSIINRIPSKSKYFSSKMKKIKRNGTKVNF